MLAWTLLDTAPVPGSDVPLRLMQRGTEFAIRLGSGVLMGSRQRGSEEALARLGCAGLARHPAPRVLVGGFGMGFTLAASLALLGPGAIVTLAELVPAVLAWGRGPLAHLSGKALDDPRVVVREGDVAALLRGNRAAWDAILLDVDNGPEGLTRTGNDALYDHPGLKASWLALRPGGVLAVWSAAADAGFSRRLAQCGFAVEEASVHAHGRKGTRHTIWLGRR